ncbi:MAG: hypothetical protein K2O97_12080, partial [Acetatifactor sp.]|nr:hypothetical protein [Acetatifactor sp.]
CDKILIYKTHSEIIYGYPVTILWKCGVLPFDTHRRRTAARQSVYTSLTPTAAGAAKIRLQRKEHLSETVHSDRMEHRNKKNTATLQDDKTQEGANA